MVPHAMMLGSPEPSHTSGPAKYIRTIKFRYPLSWLRHIDGNFARMLGYSTLLLIPYCSSFGAKRIWEVAEMKLRDALDHHEADDYDRPISGKRELNSLFSVSLKKYWTKVPSAALKLNLFQNLIQISC